MNINLGKTLACGVVAMSLAGSAHAYYFQTCDGDKIDWPGNNQPMRGHTISFEQDAMHDALDVTVKRININPSKFRFDHSFGDSSVGFSNDQNEIWFSVDQDYLEESSGKTRVRFKCTVFTSEILETDIVLQGDFSVVDWTFSDDRPSLSVYGEDNRALRATIMHELGHALGLLHTIETYGVMGNASRHSNTNGNRARVYFGEDGASGAVRLYGTASSDIEDMGVAHWKFVEAGDDPKKDYSVHGRTVVYDLSGEEITDTQTINGERHYKVEKGQSIQVEFSYENNGKTELGVDVGFYLSGNNTITTGDLPLGTRHLTLGRNSVHTTKTTVQIPAWVPSGTYFVGAVIDHNNKIAEKTFHNNATYVGIKVLKDGVMF